MARFLEAPGVKYKAAFSVAYGAGLRVSEVAALKVSDIDSVRVHESACRARQRPQGSIRDASARAAGASARLVAHRTSKGLAVHGPGSVAADIDTPTQPRLPCGDTLAEITKRVSVATHAST